jgi:hypothetical protein
MLSSSIAGFPPPFVTRASSAARLVALNGTHSMTACACPHYLGAPAFLGVLPFGIRRLPHCVPISGQIRGELDEKQTPLHILQLPSRPD